MHPKWYLMNYRTQKVIKEIVFKSNVEVVLPNNLKIWENLSLTFLFIIISNSISLKLIYYILQTKISEAN